MCIRHGTLQWQCFVSQHHCISLHDGLKAFRRQNWISPTSDLPQPTCGLGAAPCGLLGFWYYVHLSLPRVEPRLRPALLARLTRHDEWGRKEPATHHGEARCATQSSATARHSTSAGVRHGKRRKKGQTQRKAFWQQHTRRAWPGGHMQAL